MGSLFRGFFAALITVLRSTDWDLPRIASSTVKRRMSRANAAAVAHLPHGAAFIASRSCGDHNRRATMRGMAMSATVLCLQGMAGHGATRARHQMVFRSERWPSL